MTQLEGSKIPGASGGLAGLWRRHANEFGLVIAVLAVIGLTILIDPTDAYLVKTWYNAKEILRHSSMLGIFALGAGIVIISGGIDLSSGSVIALSAAVCCSVMISLAPIDAEKADVITRGLPIWIPLTAIGVTILIAFMVGSFHAWLVTVIRLPPFIATLASLVGLRSLARVTVQDVTRAVNVKAQEDPSATGNTQIYVDDEFFKSLGSTWWIPLVIFCALAFIVWMLMSRTVVGRHLYAIGGNEEAARLSGIRVARLKWLAYCIGAVTASIAGILYSSYVAGSMPENQGLGYELNAIAASVVGGCSLAGGIGTIPGIMLGALFLRVVMDSVVKTVKNNPDEFQGLIVGFLVVLAVTYNELRGKRAGRKEFLPGALGIVNIVVITLLAGTVGFVISSEGKTGNGLTVASIALAVLISRKIVEVRAARKEREGAS